jgi:hypothetical protein
MSDRQLELAARRAALIVQASEQRDHLKLLAGNIKEGLAGIDQGIEVVRAVANKPTVLAGAVAMVSFIGPRRLLRAAARSAMLITTGRRVFKLLGR